MSKGKFMSKGLLGLSAAAVIAAGLMSAMNSASAIPVADALAINKAVPAAVEQVRWGWGWGVGAGLLGGAIVGGALASPYYYGAPYGYAPGYYYPAPAYGPPVYGPPPDAVAYCSRRYRSYDPNSGTFLGNDGYRHPCP
jgi:hypothetical protein